MKVAQKMSFIVTALMCFLAESQIWCFGGYWRTPEGGRWGWKNARPKHGHARADQQWLGVPNGWNASLVLASKIVVYAGVNEESAKRTV